MAEYDYKGLYEFLTQTPEQGLRKMLVDPKAFTDVHFSLLLKTVRAGGEKEFVDCAENKTFPKVKMSPNETKLKENFWKDAIQTFNSRGILNPFTGSKAA